MMDRLDTLTKKHTEFSTFAHLCAGGADAEGAPVQTDYFPSLFPAPYSSREVVDELRELVEAYDSNQRLRGDVRRAYRGEAHWWQPGQGPGPKQDGYELYPIEGGYRVEKGGKPVGSVLEAVGRGRVYRPTAGRQVPCDRDEAVRRLLRASAAAA